MTNLTTLIQELHDICLATYRAGPLRIKEDAGKEEEVQAGSYRYRQVLELVQNGV